jgi:hypothetical protein
MLILPPGHARAVAAKPAAGGRDRWFVWAASGLAALLAIAVIVSLSTGSAAPRKGCLDVTFASSLGGEELHGCGVTARRICAQVGAPQGYTGDLGRQVARRCHTLHLPVGG